MKSTNRVVMPLYFGENLKFLGEHIVAIFSVEG
jgi:hypothetical protein